MEPHSTSFFANLDDTQATPLHWAALRGNLGEVQALLASKRKIVTVTDSHGWTALHWAVGAGQAECAAALVRAGASLEARGREARTPWMAQLAKGFLFDSPACHARVDELAAAGLVEEAQNLREEMARQDAKATAGATPLHVAAGMGAVDCIRCLLQQKPRWRQPTALGSQHCTWQRPATMSQLCRHWCRREQTSRLVIARIMRRFTWQLVLTAYIACKS